MPRTSGHQHRTEYAHQYCQCLHPTPPFLPLSVSLSMGATDTDWDIFVTLHPKNDKGVVCTTIKGCLINYLGKHRERSERE